MDRGTCPVCGAEVSIKRHGRVLFKHKDRRHSLYGTGQDKRVPRCPGSNRPENWVGAKRAREQRVP